MCGMLMIVSELITKLQTLPPTAKVLTDLPFELMAEVTTVALGIGYQIPPTQNMGTNCWVGAEPWTYPDHTQNVQCVYIGTAFTLKTPTWQII
jgi:hypothetical protein